MTAAQPTPARIGVVIPFFQREAGLLRRAMLGIAAQTGLGTTPVHVIVVDDASPFSPADDLTGITLPDPMTVDVLAQSNGGAGAARNAGIERAQALGCTHLAFLDSDDVWRAHHLSTALAALADSPFYFANSMHDDVSSFSYFAGMRGRDDDGVIDGQATFALLLDECIPHTSQVVYRLDGFPDVRFDETMRRTGEDHLFWLTVASRGAAMAYCNRIMGDRGSGVSIYREALAWDSPAFIPRLFDAFRFRTLVAKRFALTADQTRLNNRHRQDAADEIAFALARQAIRSPRRVAKAAGGIVRAGPSLWRAIAAALPRLPAIRRRMAAP